MAIILPLALQTIIQVVRKTMNLFHYVKKLFFAETAQCLLCNRPYGMDSSFNSLLAGICLSCKGKIRMMDEPLCPICGREMERQAICHDCERRAHTYFQSNRSAVSYTPIMKEWINAYKYRGREQLSAGLIDLLHQAYLKYYTGIKIDVITFVPLHAERLYERKFNQAEQLARGLSKRIGIPVAAVLQRRLDTMKQSRRGRKERLTSLIDAFQYAGKIPVSRSILLIDDIYTTGSTANECAKVLSKNGWDKIYILTVARA